LNAHRLDDATEFAFVKSCFIGEGSVVRHVMISVLLIAARVAKSNRSGHGRQRFGISHARDANQLNFHIRSDRALQLEQWNT
jgi:hypothetical protein